MFSLLTERERLATPCMHAGDEMLRTYSDVAIVTQKKQETKNLVDQGGAKILLLGYGSYLLHNTIVVSSSIDRVDLNHQEALAQILQISIEVKIVGYQLPVHVLHTII